MLCWSMASRAHRPGDPLATSPAPAAPVSPLVPVLALAHVVLAAAGVVAVVVLVVAGTRPDAELEALYTFFGLVLAVPVLAFTVAAAACLRWVRTAPRRAARVSLALGVVELALAGALLWGVVVAVQGYGEPAPWRSPLLLPALVVAVVGGAAVVEAVRTLRTG